MTLLNIILIAALALTALTHAPVRNKILRRPPAEITPDPDRSPPANMLTLNERYVHEQEHILYPDKPREFYKHRDCRVCGPGPLRNGQVPSKYPHVFIGQVTAKDDYGFEFKKDGKVASPSEADYVSSEVETHPGHHTFMLDIDFPARLVPSSSPGHYHLYVDKKLPWREYLRFLKAAARAGLVEEQFYKMARRNKATYLRPPWKDKHQ